MRLVLLCLCMSTAAALAEAPDTWKNVRTLGAQADGVQLDTGVIQEAMDACAAQGGGTVFFPAGKYLAGSLHLRSRVTLYLENGATLLGSRERKDYDDYEQVDFENDADSETSFFHLALLWGEDVEHVAILGQGIIDSNFSKRKGPKAIALKRCRNVTIRDVTLQNIPNYAISMLGTDYVNIDGVTILNGFADGIDPDACRNVRISNCHIETLDDAIVPKASFSLGERRSTENITVTNCYLATECNGFKLGTESGGDFKRIAVSNCVISALPGRRPPRGGICLESVDGSNIDGVVVSNITQVGVRMPVFLRLGNRGRDLPTPVPGSLRNVSIDNIVATGATMPCTIAGIPGHPIEHVTVSNLRVDYAGGPPYCAPEDVAEIEAEYPDPEMFAALPAYGLYARHVRELALQNVNFTYSNTFWRIATPVRRDVQWVTESGAPQPSQPAPAGPALLFDDVARLRLDGVSARQAPDSPAIHLINVQDALLEGLLGQAQEPVQVSGDQSRNIRK